MAVPFLDLKRQYETIKGEVEPKLVAVAQSQRYILGPEVETFEKEVAQYLGVKHALGVASGTDALILSLKAAGVTEINGSVTADDSLFEGQPLPGSWGWEDIGNYYAAQPTALAMNDNLFVEIKAVVDYDSRPAPGSQNFDEKFMVGVGWSF